MQILLYIFVYVSFYLLFVCFIFVIILFLLVSPFFLHHFVCCMLGWRSQNLELMPLDPDLEKTLRRNRRAPVKRETVEMGDNVRNANQSEYVGQPRFENQDARAENFEQARADNFEQATSLRDLIAPVVTSSHSCIMLPRTNTTHFD